MQSLRRCHEIQRCQSNFCLRHPKKKLFKISSTSRSLLYLHITTRFLYSLPLISSAPGWLGLGSPSQNLLAFSLDQPAVMAWALRVEVPLMVLGIIYPDCWALYRCHIAAVTEFFLKVVAPKGLLPLEHFHYVFWHRLMCLYKSSQRNDRAARCL